MKIVENLTDKEFVDCVTNYHFPLLKEISSDPQNLINKGILGRFDDAVPCSILLYSTINDTCILECVEDIDGRDGYYSGAGAQLVMYLIKKMKQEGYKKVELTCPIPLSKYFVIFGFDTIQTIRENGSYYMVREL